MEFTKLILYSSQLSAQKEFYAELLGMQVLEESASSFALKCGKTELVFEQAVSLPPYHFAINIPPFQEQEALKWLKARVEVLHEGSDEITDFSNWNARALYFYDPDGNIVELISRRNLPYEKALPFGAEAFCEISEMGLSTVNIEAVCEALLSSLETEVFDGAPIRFCAIGEETGLFICVDAHQKIWYPTKVPAMPADFKLQLRHKGLQRIVEYIDGHLQIKG